MNQDWFSVNTSIKNTKSGIEVSIYPECIIKPYYNDIMTKGRDFYAIWNSESCLWDKNPATAQRIVDTAISERESVVKQSYPDPDIVTIKPSYMAAYNNGYYMRYVNWLRTIPDTWRKLDQQPTFLSDNVTKEDLRSIRLSYDPVNAPTPNFDRLFNVLYDQSELDKFFWAVGAIITGHAYDIQKVLVIHGSPGTGKSTLLNLLMGMFPGYYTAFNVADLMGKDGGQFVLSPFENFPLFAIDADGNMSRVDENTLIDKVSAHDVITINAKFKHPWSTNLPTLCIVATNYDVKFTDPNSGMRRRVLDINPTGNLVTPSEYEQAFSMLKYEYGGIAYKCIETFRRLGLGYYKNYVCSSMIERTDPISAFMLEYHDQLKTADAISLKQLFDWYKIFCDEWGYFNKFNRGSFMAAIQPFFKEYSVRGRVEGRSARSVFSGYLADKVMEADSDINPSTRCYEENKEENVNGGCKVLDIVCDIPGELDATLADAPAQLSDGSGRPKIKWDNCTTTLKEIDCTKEHYVRVPENLICIDFDIIGEDGEKNLEANLKAAAEFPPTYAELSKSGKGVHLHYWYDGDPTQLAYQVRQYIEVKVFTGKASLRRKMTLNNGMDISHIGSGLPLKKEKKVVNSKDLENEKHLRALIVKGLNKEVHNATKPSIDYIAMILEKAYNQEGFAYDVSDMYNDILAFAIDSTNQSDYCVKKVKEMQEWLCSKTNPTPLKDREGEIIFYDVEIFPNLFLVNWKYLGDPVVHRMINPSPQEMQEFITNTKLVGYNNRDYDNHMVYARYLGYSVEELFQLSQDIIVHKDQTVKFPTAYNLSYTDVKDYTSSRFKSLKEWEIELGIHHQELDIPWDEPVPEEKWQEVAEYCDNDVVATEAVWNATQSQFESRMILAELADLTPNHKTNKLVQKIIFGDDTAPKLVYSDLATGKQYIQTGGERGKNEPDNPVPLTPDDPLYCKYKNDFPGYSYGWFDDLKKDGTPKKNGKIFKNLYRGDDLGSGGWVYANPGVYYNVALIDVASMHPSSIIAMNYLGDYTETYKSLLDIRLKIKHKDFDSVKEMFDGKLAPYLGDPANAKKLSTALKIPLNSLYGVTHLKEGVTPMMMSRNVNNIVAVRGALFMRTLQDEVAARGFTVAHIKTDSIKIPNATPEIIQFCLDFAKIYGYTFEHEATYERMCLVNGSTYIARYAEPEWCEKTYGYCPGDNAEHGGQWTATAAQFQEPYVFKTLFSKEPIEFNDLCVTKTSKVQGDIFLDMNESLPEGEHDYVHIGKAAWLVPIKQGKGGGRCVRPVKKMVKEKNENGEINERLTEVWDNITGCKDYRWFDAEVVMKSGNYDIIDYGYFDALVEDAKQAIEVYIPFDEFVNFE